MAGGEYDRSEYEGRPAVLVFADDAAAMEAADRAVLVAGGRVAAALPVEAAVDRIEMQPSLAAVLLDVREDRGAALDALLDLIERSAVQRRFASVVIVPLTLIDAASARIVSEDVILLCEPSDVERTEAVARALARRGSGVAEEDKELHRLAQEVARIAQTLEAIASDEGRRGTSARGETPTAGEGIFIKALIRARRLRGQFFPAELFADPAWDMLLDLMAAQLDGRPVAVSSLCIASEVPPTTALRWINTMTEAGLFRRVADSKDGRRVFIELTETAAAAMTAYLEALQRVLALRT